MSINLVILGLNMTKEFLEAIKANMDNSPDKAKETKEAVIAIFIFLNKLLEKN